MQRKAIPTRPQVPKAAPKAIPKAAPKAIPKAAPKATPKAAPTAVPKAASAAAPKIVPKAASAAVSKAAPTPVPKAAPTTAKPKITPPKEAPTTAKPKITPPKKGGAFTPDWIELEKNVSICAGSYSQAHKRFRGHNQQSTAVCIVACALASLRKMNTWDRRVLDLILETGTNLHLKSRQFLGNRCLEHLKPTEVYKYFYLGNLKVSMRLGATPSGDRVPRDAFMLQKMENLLNQFFKSGTYGIFSCQQTDFAIWRSDKFFYVFDPTEHSLTGDKWTGLPGLGYCYCIRTTSTRALADILLKNCPLKQINRFTIYPCAVEKTIEVDITPPETLEEVVKAQPAPVPLEIEKKPLSRLTVSKKKTPPPVPVEKAPSPPAPTPAPTTPAAPPTEQAPEKAPPAEPKKSVSKSMIPPERPKLQSVTNFVNNSAGTAGILRASTHQCDPKFTRYMGTQSLSNAVAALTMLRQYKSKRWITNILDDVLKLGEVIHHDSKVLPKGKVPEKVTLNERDYSPKVETYGAIGRLGSSNDKILNLEQALGTTLIDTDCCILVGPNIVAIWKEDNRYYMFDPNERNRIGEVVAKGEPGVACVTWFNKLSSLVNVYLSNVPKQLRKERFMLCKVQIQDYTQLAQDWNNFKALTFNKWILRGNFSQQDRRFPPESRNAQCTANATMALTYKELKEEKDWNKETVDQVLINGDQYYQGCVQVLQEQGKFKDKYLMVDEVKRNFDVENKRVNLEIEDCLVNGIVNAKSDTGIPNLKKGFEEFFHDSDAGIITANLQSMAVWKKDNTYYYYDSHSRNEKGVLCSYGTACIIRMVTIEDLANALMINLNPDRQNLYNISKVIVRLLDLTEEGAVKPPLNLYVALSDLIAILRSSTSQKDKKFGISAGKQTVPTCLAALALNALTPSFEWTVEDVDEVLTLGDQLYSESMAANYGDEVPEDVNVDEISTANVKNEVKIGANRLEWEYEDVSSGVLTNLKEAVEGLSQRAEAEGNDVFRSILESEYMTVAFWRDDNLFYLFDPQARDERGQVYGKDDWSVKKPEEEEGEEEEDEDEEKDEEESDEDKFRWGDEEDKDEMAGGDNLGEPEDDEDKDEVEDEDKDEEGEEEEEEEKPPVEKKGSAFWRQKEEEGKACVMRFSRVDDLVQHILDNSPPTKHDAIDYSLKSVKESNTPIIHEIFDPASEQVKKDDIAGDWNEFKEIDYGKWILRSVRNLRDGLFPVCNRGKQGIPMCLVALVYTNFYALSKFNQDVLNDILAYGDRLYTVVLKLRNEELKKLKRELNLTDDEVAKLLADSKFGITDYPKSMCMGEKRGRWEVAQEATEGDITSKIPEVVYDVSSGLTAFFAENKYGIMTCRDYPVGVWTLDDAFYMFDPRPSGPSGVKSPVGVSCITRFINVDDLAKIYVDNLPSVGNNMFEIRAFTLTKEECQRERQPEVKVEKVPRVGGFNSVMAGKSILRGDVKLDCTKFDRGVHLHSAPIAFVALALSLNKDPDTWTRIIVNEILTVGEELYNDTLRKLGDKFDPWGDQLDICKVNTDFKIGSLKVNCAIRFTEQKGIVDVKNSKTLNLRQGLEKFFEENSHGVVIADKFILPVWEQVKGEDVSIFMFDPNSRGGTGLPGQGGVACVMKFCNAKVASDHIMACMMDIDKTKTPFSVVPVEIVVGSVRTRRKRVSPKVAVRSKGEKTLGIGITTATEKSTTKTAQALSQKTATEKSTRTALPQKSHAVSTVPAKTLVGATIRSLRKPPPGTTIPVTCPDKSTLQEEKSLLRKIAEKERACKEAKRCANLGRDAFYEINSNQSILRGLRSVTKDRELPVNLVAFVFMKISSDLNKWTYKQIELILEAGYQLYVDSFNAYKPDTSKLDLQHVLRRVILKDFEVKIEIKKPIIGDALTKDNLLAHLTNFFTITNFCIICYGECLVSVYFKSGRYYLFDAYSRDLNGNDTENGSAVLMRFGDLEDVVDKVVKNLRGTSRTVKRYALLVVVLQGVQPLAK